jgi:hypothetical protein
MMYLPSFVKKTHFNMSLMTGSYMCYPVEQALIHSALIAFFTMGTYISLRGAVLGSQAIQGLVS